jgi:hypothetical protein
MRTDWQAAVTTPFIIRNQNIRIASLPAIGGSVLG